MLFSLLETGAELLLSVLAGPDIVILGKGGSYWEVLRVGIASDELALGTAMTVYSSGAL